MDFTAFFEAASRMMRNRPTMNMRHTRPPRRIAVAFRCPASTNSHNFPLSTATANIDARPARLTSLT
ncbi:hypothetical protein RU07_04275 [Agrobacterium tumefaciens]|uniref:Uncharacterized protein n=1 Tax=Agrobacterium tumefaciens TaxID=358 RepID=A0A0D0KXR4_AGRTU|nr:hypothetical protein RU07_04275 [Agrobacterium tumefaciens]